MQKTLTSQLDYVDLESYLQKAEEFTNKKFTRKALQPKQCKHKFKGVTYKPTSSRPWEAYVYDRDTEKNKYLGRFSTPEEAAKAHDIAAIEMYGPNTQVNFPKEKGLTCKRLS